MKKPYRFTKRKDKPYIQVTFAHIPNRWFSTHTTDMTQAVLFAEKKLQQVNGNDEDITLKEFATDFFTPKDPHGYRKRLQRRDEHYEDIYFEQHQSRLDNYILKNHGAYLLSSLKDTLIEDFIIDLPKVSNSTRNKILACYRIVLTEAVREGYLQHNPANEVKALPENNEQREVFTEEELALLFPENDEELIRLWNGKQNLDGLKYGVYFLIELDTGWRPSEVSALTVDNYFPELHGVYSDKGVSWHSHTLTNHIKTTNKGQKFKNGFLSERTERLLKRYISTLSTSYLFLLSDKYKTTPKGDLHFIYSENANQRLREVAEKIGLDLRGRTQYSLRHTFNTNAIGRLPENARLILMGHRKNRSEYDHLTPKQTLERVNDLIQKEKAD